MNNHGWADDAHTPVRNRFKVCVMAGARGGAELMPDAYAIGKMLARSGVHTYFGGSNKGVMGALSAGVIDAGGRITGVLPASIAALNHFNPDVDMVITDNMATRKAHFWSCHAFLCLPGGYGTLDELFEIATETKLGHQEQRPIVVYNQSGFYNSLRMQLRKMVDFGLMPQERADLIKFVSTPEEAIYLVTKTQPVASESPYSEITIGSVPGSDTGP